MAERDADISLRCVSFFAVNEFVPGWLTEWMFNSRVQVGDGHEDVVVGQTFGNRLGHPGMIP